MNWGTIAAAITTGVVGITGTILGAWLTTRSQTANLLLSINAEDRRVKNVEKRQIHATCLGAFEEMSSFHLTFLFLSAKKRDDPELNEAVEGYQKATHAAQIAVNTAELIASAEVSELLDRLRKAHVDSVNDVITKKPMSSEARNIGAIRRQLYVAMRADLGEPIY